MIRERLPARFARPLGRQGMESAITSLSYLATAGLGFVNGPLLARSLGADGRGDLAAVVATTQLLGFMINFGLPKAAVYFATEIRWRSIIMSSWTSVIVFAVPFTVVLIPVYNWILDERTDNIRYYFYAYLAANLLAGPVTTTIFWLRGMSRTIAFNLLNALPAVFTSAAYIGLFVFGRLDLESALMSTLIAQVVSRVITLVYARAYPGPGFHLKEYKRQVNYGFRAWIGNLSYLVTFRVDQFVLAGLVASSDLGYYAIAATGATLSLPLSRGISQTLLPHVRKAPTPQRQLAAVDRAVRWTQLGSGGTLVLLAVLSPFAVPFLFGEDFRPAIVPLLILLPGQFASDLATVYAAALDAFNRPEAASAAQLASAGVTAVGLAVLAPIYGIEGAAAVTSAAYAANLAVMLVLYRRTRATLLAQPEISELSRTS